jgi:hypothetical protein
MQEKTLKIFKWVLILGTIFKIVCSVLITIYTQKVAEELLKQNNYYTFIRDSVIFKWDRNMGERELKENIEKMSSTFVLVVGIIDGKFKKKIIINET